MRLHLCQCTKSERRLFISDGSETVNVVFVYDGVTYDGDSEAKFLKEHSDRDDFEEWKAKWLGSFRTDMWEPEFLEELNDELDD